eukprot:CAMPEP_0204821482 /NCGR_PEP_ID=MMETSP1018-20131115/20876_1 /ASSEMBLY_ACC=CAM_ASM_000518 /TAXON_ID=46462 /ORGANISM="Anophryoides haemophila, Strain AH6" /LENGTH=51 /DNA_ID=CAMNT_0051933027 /DNA_START=553 /DNA_END=708 /DNA_ORIENTATION=-
MKENGAMIWLMVEEYIFTVEELDMKESGKMIYKMDKESKLGPMVQNMREVI